MPSRAAAVAVVLALGVVGCATERRTQPDQTATEQLLVTRAVDRAMDRIHPSLAPGTAAWVDARGFKDFAERYVIGAIEDRLLRTGARLVARRGQADVVVEARVGALSVDQHKSLVGIPGYEVPIPFASAPLDLPEIALYSRDQQRGTAKITLTAYDAKAGAPRHLGNPAYGFAHKTDWTAALFVDWTTDDLFPEHVKAREEGTLGTGFDLSETYGAPDEAKGTAAAGPEGKEPAGD